jgi:hypothetical protein
MWWAPSEERTETIENFRIANDSIPQFLQEIVDSGLFYLLTAVGTTSSDIEICNCWGNYEPNCIVHLAPF